MAIEQPAYLFNGTKTPKQHPLSKELTPPPDNQDFPVSAPAAATQVLDFQLGWEGAHATQSAIKVANYLLAAQTESFPITAEVLSSSVRGQISLAQSDDIDEVLPGDGHREKAMNYLRSLLLALSPEFAPLRQEMKSTHKDDDRKASPSYKGGDTYDSGYMAQLADWEKSLLLRPQPCVF